MLLQNCLARANNLSDLTDLPASRENLKLVIPGWITPPLLNGWSNYGSGLALCQYRKSWDGRVEVKAVLAPPSNLSGDHSVVFNLPTGCRPGETRIFTSIGPNYNAYWSNPVFVGSSGDVTVVWQTGQSPAIYQTIELTFVAEQ